MQTRYKFLAAGVGAWAILSLLRKAEVSAKAMRGNTVALNGYEAPTIGYDPLMEAIGCNCGGGFGDVTEMEGAGLGASFGKKLKKGLKKAAKAPVSAVKKVAKAPLQQVKKATSQLKRDVRNVAKPLQRDFKKGFKLMKQDFRKAGGLFKGGGKARKQKNAATGATEYYDENGNRITEAQYNAIMAQYEQEYAGASPADAMQASGFTDETPTISMDDAAADFFAQSEEAGVDTNALVYDQAASLFTGGEDATDPNLQIAQNWFDAPEYPEAIAEQTMDAFAMQQTEGDNLIMPAGEPATPYSADELLIAYEEDAGEWRGDAYRPDADNWMNPYTGGAQLPAYAEGYEFAEDIRGSTIDYDWGMEGLGAVVAKPGPHGFKKPKPMALYKLPGGKRPMTTYGYPIRPSPGAQRYPLLADKRGNVYTRVGGSMHRLGTIDALAGGEGLGCAMFARDLSGGGLGGWGDIRRKGYKGLETSLKYGTGTGLMITAYKKVDPKHYREGRKGAKVAKPYALIAGGTALTVVSLGAGTPAGAAAIAAGVAELGAQTYSDIQERKAEQAIEKANRKLDQQIEQDRINEAIASGDVIATSQDLDPVGGPATGEIPGGDWPHEYAGDGVWADFLDLTDSLA